METLSTQDYIHNTKSEFDIIVEIIALSKGVLIEAQNLKPIKQIKLKDLFKYDIYLYIYENKVYIYPVENITGNITENLVNSSIIVDNDIIDNGALIFANYIYNSTYYKIRFKQCEYSKNANEYIQNRYWKPDTYINLYSAEDITNFYIFEKDLFDSIKIISNILYRFDLNKFIETFKVSNNI